MSYISLTELMDDDHDIPLQCLSEQWDTVYGIHWRRELKKRFKIIKHINIKLNRNVCPDIEWSGYYRSTHSIIAAHSESDIAFIVFMLA